MISLFYQDQEEHDKKSILQKKGKSKLEMFTLIPDQILF